MPKTTAFVLVATLCLAIGACQQASEVGPPAPDSAGFDTPQPSQSRPARQLLANALIVDGLGEAGFRGDVGIADGIIVALGPSGTVEIEPGAEVVDLDGLVLAPGFVDIHNHSDGAIARQPQAEALLSQGLTTIMVGADGGSQWPIDDYLRRVDEAQPALNVAVMAGHGTVRQRVMGDDYKREANDSEIAEMRGLVDEGMRQGAFGLSSGLEYDPGFYSSTAELIALAEVAAEHGGFYMSHMRDEEETVMDAIDEAIEIGSAASLPVQISHIKMGNASVWNRAPEALEKIAEARQRGVDVMADWYPYTAWASSLSIVVRSRRFEDPDAVAEGLAALGGAERLQITRYAADPSVEGLRLDEIAARKERTPIEMYIEMMQAGGASVIGHTMNVDDVNAFATSPWVMVCSDGGIGSSHPRGAGTFPRVLAHYVRDEGILPLELAVQKMSYMPAQRLGLLDRGRIEVGAVADLVAFDPETVRDTSTFEQPELPPVGIEHVWVSGDLVWRSGEATGTRPGRALRRQ